MVPGRQPEQDPAPLPYLQQDRPNNYDMQLDVGLRAAQMNQAASICRTNFKYMYWSSLQQLVPATQILFGTDFPPGGTSAAVAKTIADLGLFSDADVRAIDRDNAVRLLPRFKT